MYLDSDNRRQLTPQLALRVAIIGGVALVAFGLVFFRLWYLQVLSGDRYKAEASDNRVREIKVQAPRGEIVDREGRVLVDNRTGLAVRVTPKELPADPAERRDVYAPPGRGPEDEARPRGAHRGAPAQGAALLAGHGEGAGGPADRPLPVREPGGLPGRDRGAGVPAPVPPQGGGRAPVRHRAAR